MFTFGVPVRYFIQDIDDGQVNRVAITDTLGQITVEPQLLPYDFPEVPEQFLVV